VGQFGGQGFHVAVALRDGPTIAATYYAATRRKRITIDGEDQPTVAAAIGRWLAVGFFPTDLDLVQGGAAERRRWLDRMLSLGDREYLDALLRYRGALAQRNAALRGGDINAADAFNPALAAAGSLLTTRRRAWAASAVARWHEELETLGEATAVSLRYRGDDALDDAAAWQERMVASRQRDLARCQTHTGPHRDDLVLGLGGHALRHYGSTGQQRTAAIALRLLELETLADARQERPALLVDDVFAELDRERQRRLATRLLARPGQRIVTAPRSEEIPPELELPRWDVQHGMIRQVLSI
jgi:DNA replication and repair protein RecF